MVSPTHYAYQGDLFEDAARKMSREHLEEIAAAAMHALCDSEIGFNIEGQYPNHPGIAAALGSISEFVTSTTRNIDRASQARFSRFLQEAFALWVESEEPTYDPWGDHPKTSANRWRPTNGRG